MHDLSATLDILRSKGVRAARFHADGTLAAVDFEGPVPVHPDTEAAPAADVPEPYRNALEILSGGHKRPHAEAE
jgi:hypothetical protein